MLKVLQIAQAEVGTHESGDNGTLYARDLDAIHYFNTPKQNLAWCAVFVCWCFVQAYGADEARRVLFQPEQDNCAAACSYAANYYRQRGRFGLSPKIGAQIFFGQNARDHTGLVYSYDAARVYTIEGNSDDQVARRSYDLTNPWIAGYGYPDYESLPNKGEESGEPPVLAYPDECWYCACCVEACRTGALRNYRVAIRHHLNGKVFHIFMNTTPILSLFQRQLLKF